MSKGKKNVYYHGTTEQDYEKIKLDGLRKGTWVTPDRAVAVQFAVSRAEHLHSRVVLLEVRAKVGPVRNDRSGRPECLINKTDVWLKYRDSFTESWGGVITRHDLYKCRDCKDTFVSTNGREPELAAGDLKR